MAEPEKIHLTQKLTVLISLQSGDQSCAHTFISQLKISGLFCITEDYSSVGLQKPSKQKPYSSHSLNNTCCEENPFGLIYKNKCFFYIYSSQNS